MTTDLPFTSVPSMQTPSLCQAWSALPAWGWCTYLEEDELPIVLPPWQLGQLGNAAQPHAVDALEGHSNVGSMKHRPCKGIAGRS